MIVTYRDASERALAAACRAGVASLVPESHGLAAVLALLRREPDLMVGDNEPYAMDGTDFTAPFHAHRRGLDAVEVEVRQDHLQSLAGLEAMARLFARVLPIARDQAAPARS